MGALFNISLRRVWSHAFVIVLSIHRCSLGYNSLKAQEFTVPLYAVAYVATIALSLLSDRKRARGLIACGSFTAAAVSFIILLVTS